MPSLTPEQVTERDTARTLYAEKLQLLAKTCQELSLLWETIEGITGEEVVARLYPFEKSFDEMVLSINSWMVESLCKDCHTLLVVSPLGDDVCDNPSCFLYQQ